LQEKGGLKGLLPLLDKCQSVEQVNAFFKILLQVLHASAEHDDFFQLLFTVLRRLPTDCVSCETIQLLAEIRFTIQHP